MPTVTNTVKYPNQSLAAGRVEIDLVGDLGEPITSGAFVTAGNYALAASYAADLVAGVWSVSLVANSLINPPGNRWRVTETLLGYEHDPTVYYLDVPNGAGPYFVEDILDEEPESIGSSALRVAVAALEEALAAKQAVFDVTAYGAVGDGVTDDSAAIQDAIDAMGSGATLYFPGPAIYRVASGLLVEDADGITWKGDGWQSIIRSAAHAAPGWDKIVRFNDCTGVIIRDLAFDNKADRFGGIEFYDCQQVHIDRCRAFNSVVTANPDDKDRRSFYFYSADPPNSASSDIWITRSRIEDLQLEAHASKRVFIVGNEVYRSPVTGGILCIVAEDNCEVEDVWIVDNFVENIDGGAIYVLYEGACDNCTFRGVHITGNRIKCGTANSTRGIYIGTGSVATASVGNVFHDFEISGNQIWVTVASGTLTLLNAILINNGPTSAIDVRRFNIHDNVVYGNGTGAGISLGYADDSTVAGNRIHNTEVGITLSRVATTVLERNAAQATLTDFEHTNSRGGNIIRHNQPLGTPTNRYNVTALVAGDQAETDRFFATTTIDPANLANGASQALGDTTVTGAALGDKVDVSFSVSLLGTFMWGEVVSADTVRIFQSNMTGSAQNVGSGTCRILVTRRAP